MRLRVRDDGLDCGGRVVHVAEREQALAGRKVATKPGVLRDDRPPCSQIGRAAVAEPTSAEANVLILGDREFTGRAADVVTVGAQVGRPGQGRTDPPTMRFELDAGAVVIAAQRELERATAPL